MLVDLNGSGVWSAAVILLIVLILSVGFYLFADRMKKTAWHGLQGAGRRLRKVRGRFSQIVHALHGYAPDDPEPYGSRLEVLYTHLQDFDHQTAALEQRYVAIQEYIRRPSANRWREVVAAPWIWWRIRRAVQDLRAELDALQEKLELIEELFQQIADLAWDVAGQIRQAAGQQARLSQLLVGLRSQGVTGELLEAAGRQEAQQRTALTGVPAVFLQADQATLLQEADKAAIIQVYAVAAESRPILDALLAQARVWDEHYTLATSGLAALHQLLGRLEATLASTPEGLTLDILQENCKQAQATCQALQLQLERADVARLPDLIREGTQAHQVAQDMQARLAQAVQGRQTLENSLADLGQSLKGLSALCASLATHSIHPVQWETSQNTLTDLNRRCHAQGPARKLRTPEEVERDLSEVAELLRLRERLTRVCQEAASQHAEMVALLSSPEFANAREWLIGRRSMLENVAVYDADNWPRQDAIQSLPSELNNVEDRLKALAFDAPATPVAESILAQRLEEIRQLAQTIKVLAGRLSKVQMRLEEIQATERTAVDQVNRLKVALNQINLLVGSNALLTQVASAELKRLQSSLEQIQVELSQPRRGTVEKKARAADGLVVRSEADANGWLDQLGKDIEAQRTLLADHLTALDSIAQVEEPVIQKTRQLLSAGQAFGALGTWGEKSTTRFDIDTLILELKRRCEYWESCRAVQREIEELQEPLVQTYETAGQNRDATRMAFKELSGWRRSLRDWPPSSLTVEPYEQELARLEENWQRLKSQHGRAASLVAQLGQLSTGYITLAEKIRQAAARAEAEQEQCEGLQAEVDELLQRWQNLLSEYRDNSLASGEIQALLKAAEKDLAATRREYRGHKDYQQALTGMQSVRRRLRQGQVALDEDHSMDVDGRRISYRR